MGPSTSVGQSNVGLSPINHKSDAIPDMVDSVLSRVSFAGCKLILQAAHELVVGVICSERVPQIHFRGGQRRVRGITLA